MRSLLYVAAALSLCGCKKSEPEKTPDKPASTPPAPANPVGSAGSATAPASADTAARPATPTAAKTTTPEAKLARYNSCWDSFNAGKDEEFVSCFGADAVREQVDSIPELIAKGPDKILDMVKAQRAAFPDLKVTPQLVMVSGNDIVAILHVTGTNSATVGEMKATGNKLGLFEAQLAVLGDDGLFSHDSLYVDQPTVFSQLGLIENESSPKAIATPTTKVETAIAHDDDREKANKAIVQKDIDAVNKKDAAAIDAITADDVKFTYHGEKQKIDTKKAYMKWVRELLDSTKDGKVDVKSMRAAGDFVAISDIFTGTPVGEAKTVETHVVQVFRIVNGKIKQHQIFANRLKTAVQLGMVDPDELMQTLSGGGDHDVVKPKK